MGIYSPILILQGFCLYHAYSRGAENKWYFIIMLFPLIGALIYLYDTFYSRRKVDSLAEGVKTAFVSNYQTRKLENELSISNTIANKINLADEYYQLGRNEDALELYNSCLRGIYKDDPELLKKIIRCLYAEKDYESIVEVGQRMLKFPNFNKSEEKICLAWSCHHTGKSTLAQKYFSEMNTRFGNYLQRIEYAKFLDSNEFENEAKSLLIDLIDEIDSLDAYERRNKKQYHQEIKRLLKSF